MRGKKRSSVHIITISVLVCLFAISCTVYAAPPAPQKGGSGTSTVSSSAGSNTPAPASITITNPPGGGKVAIWRTGGSYEIQWRCNGTRSNLVDVSLWKDGKQYAVIAKGVAMGQTLYTVPPDTAVGGYELRVTSESDAGVEAKQPISIASPTPGVTGATPKGK